MSQSLKSCISKVCLYETEIVNDYTVQLKQTCIESFIQHYFDVGGYFRLPSPSIVFPGFDLAMFLIILHKGRNKDVR